MIGWGIVIFICCSLFLLFISFYLGTKLSFQLLWKKRFGARIGYSLILGIVIFVFLFTVVNCLLMYIDKTPSRKALSRDYWSDRGSVSWLKLSYYTHRMPLEYPYELYRGEHQDKAYIHGWWYSVPDGARSIKSIMVGNILTIYKHNSLVIGECSKSDYNTKLDAWFIFDCNVGRKKLYKDREEFLDAIKELGLPTDLEFTPVKQAWKEFWADSSNWKGKEPVPVRSDYAD